MRSHLPFDFNGGVGISREGRWDRSVIKLVDDSSLVVRMYRRDRDINVSSVTDGFRIDVTDGQPPLSSLGRLQ